MKRLLKTHAAGISSACLLVGVSHSATVTWDGPGTPSGPTYSWFDGTNWVGGSVPVNGDLADLEVDNVQRTYDINNGGAGVNLPGSEIVIGRGVYTDSVGSDDGIIANIVRFNGAGGSAPVINVPVSAPTITSNRHAAVFNAATTFTNVLYGGSHQLRGEWNVSPTGPITFFELAATDGRGSTDFDDNVEINADLTVVDFTQIWGGLTVGVGATFTVSGTYEKAISNPSGGAVYANQSRLFLDGNMNVAAMTFDGVDQGTGTWGRVGSGADNEVDWIFGDGLLTVIPEPGTSMLALFGLSALGLRRRRA